MKFSKKTAHRLIVSLSMFAPVIYLFGAMFFGLAGAHGEKIYEDEIIIDQTPTYEELMTPDNFRYDGFDWENEHGRRLGFSFGYYLVENLEHVNFDFGSLGVLARSDYPNEVRGLGWFGSDELTTEFALYFDDGDEEFYVDEALTEDYERVYVAFYGIGSDGGVWTAFIGEYSFSSEVFMPSYYYWSTDEWIEGSDEWTTGQEFTLYFDDGRSLPSGVSFDDNMKSYFVPSVKPVEVSSSTYTASIFGQFFPHDNFLERVGVNALSANPIGFAPFGTFLSYLDQNMLHGSQSQMALMIYGEVYWALHIVLADLVYHVAVFFPNLIERVFDWFGQKGLNDD